MGPKHGITKKDDGSIDEGIISVDIGSDICRFERTISELTRRSASPRHARGNLSPLTDGRSMRSQGFPTPTNI